MNVCCVLMLNMNWNNNNWNCQNRDGPPDVSYRGMNRPLSGFGCTSLWQNVKS